MVCFSNIPNTLDVVFLDKGKRQVLILEIRCIFDLYMDIAFSDKLMKYQPIRANITELCYVCKLVILIYGSKLTLSGLQLAGQAKKEWQKSCSI